MENLFHNLKLLFTKFTVVAIFTFAFVTLLFALFYLIIFQNLELSMEISIKCYAIAYLMSFVINFMNMKNFIEND